MFIYFVLRNLVSKPFFLLDPQGGVISSRPEQRFISDVILGRATHKVAGNIGCNIESTAVRRPSHSACSIYDLYIIKVYYIHIYTTYNIYTKLNTKVKHDGRVVLSMNIHN